MARRPRRCWATRDRRRISVRHLAPTSRKERSSGWFETNGRDVLTTFCGVGANSDFGSRPRKRARWTLICGDEYLRQEELAEPRRVLRQDSEHLVTLTQVKRFRRRIERIQRRAQCAILDRHRFRRA